MAQWVIQVSDDDPVAMLLCLACFIMHALLNNMQIIIEVCIHFSICTRHHAN